MLGVWLVQLWWYYLQDIGDMLVVVVVVETGGGAAQLSDPSLAWPASSGPGAADTASPCVQPQHQHQHQHCTLTPGRGASCVTNSASRSSSWPPDFMTCSDASQCSRPVCTVHSEPPLCSYKLFTNCARVPISHYVNTRQLPIATCYYPCYYSCYYSCYYCTVFSSVQDKALNFKVSIQLYNCCTCLLQFIDEKQQFLKLTI